MGCKCSAVTNDVHSNMPKQRNHNVHLPSNEHTHLRQREQGEQNSNIAYLNNNNNRNIEEENRNRILTHRQINIEMFLQSRGDPNFNFPIIEDQFIGEGLKKIKSFTSIVPKEEINKKRMAFWGTRVEGNQESWQMLQQICEDQELQDDDIKAYLSVGGLVPYKNCINIVFDSFGSLYEIPNYCIHYPTKYDLPEDSKKRPKEMPLMFYVRQTVEQISVNGTNYMLIKALKMEICNKFPNLPDREKTMEKIRLFYGGKELKDENELWMYNVDNDVVIQFML